MILSAPPQRFLLIAGCPCARLLGQAGCLRAIRLGNATPIPLRLFGGSAPLLLGRAVSVSDGDTIRFLRSKSLCCRRISTVRPTGGASLCAAASPLRAVDAAEEMLQAGLAEVYCGTAFAAVDGPPRLSRALRGRARKSANRGHAEAGEAPRIGRRLTSVAPSSRRVKDTTMLSQCVSLPTDCTAPTVLN